VKFVKNPRVSIIIPSRSVDSLTEKCIQECLNLDYDNFEIILSVAVKNKSFKDKRVKVIEVGEVKPSIKRNIAMKKANGEFLAFIDSDAYPKKDWLKNAIKYFDDEKIGVVGGPNLTPIEGNFAERVSGYVLSNFWASGFAYVRYRVTKNQFVKMMPSCNYISRKKISPEYDSGFLTAEDSKFCFEIEKKGYKILYAGDVVVYHHRRNTMRKHIKQMFIYGRDISWLIKDEFSLDKVYFSILSLFSIGFIAGAILSVFSLTIRVFFLYLISLYALIILFTSIHKNIKTTFFVSIITMLTHFSYGFGFLYGVFFKNPKEASAV